MDQGKVYALATQLAQSIPNTRENMNARRLAGDLVNESLIVEDPYAYEVLFASIAPGVTAVGQIPIENDADFKCLAGTFDASIANAAYTDSTRPIPLCNVQIRNTGTGRAFFNQAVPVSAVFGTGQRPFLWPVPKLMKMRSLFEFTVTNTSVATTYTNLHLVLVGIKQYGFSQNQE
jgi:hypothetical protein